METLCFSVSMCNMFRIGYSEDIHRLVLGRKLMLGGIHIPFDLGEEAHSDGDVVLHALSEAILGALALGDLGKYFPDTSDETLNMDSKLILQRVNELMIQENYHVGNIDISIILEQPKLKNNILLMRENIASILSIDISKVSIKAGTNEGIDDIGQGKAVKAVAIVLLEENK